MTTLLPVGELTTSQILRRTVEIYQANGPYKGSYYDIGQHLVHEVPSEQCRVCILGALHLAITGDSEFDSWVTLPQEYDARLFLACELGWKRDPEWDDEDAMDRMTGYIGNWHDDALRTPEEVVAFVLVAADKAEAGARCGL